MMRRSKETSKTPFRPSRAVIESKISGGPLISALSTSAGGTAGAHGPVRRIHNLLDDDFVLEIPPTKGSSLARRNAALVQEVVRLRELSDRLSKGIQEQRRVTFAVESFKGNEPGKSEHVKRCDVETQTDTEGSIIGLAVSNASTQTSRSQTRSRSMCSSPRHEHNSPISLNLSFGRTRCLTVDGPEEIRGRPLLPFQPQGRENDESPLSLSPTSPHTPFDARVSSPSSSSVYSDDEGAEGIFSPYPLRREACCRSLRLSLQKLLRPESVTPVSYSSSSSSSSSPSSLLSHHHQYQQTPQSSATTLSSLTDSGFLSLLPESPEGCAGLALEALELKNDHTVLPAPVKRGSQHSRKQLDSLQNLFSQEKR